MYIIPNSTDPTAYHFNTPQPNILQEGKAIFQAPKKLTDDKEISAVLV